MVRAAGLLAALVALVVAPGRAGVTAQAPQVHLVDILTGGYEYTVIGTAMSDEDHNRSEGVVRRTCPLGHGYTATDFTHDYSAPTKRFTTPTVIVILPAGYRCDVTVQWLVGGAGNVGEVAQSPPTTVIAHIPVDTDRFTPDTKATARAASDSARRLAAKYYAESYYATAGLYFAISAVSDKVARDPADPAFRKRVKVRPVAPAKVPPAEFGSAAPAVDAYLSAGGDAAAAGLAMVAAIDKAPGSD